MKVKTADLLGPALDWAVAVVEGLTEENAWTAIEIFKAARAGGLYWYSTDWSQGGPLIQREKIKTDAEMGDVWRAGMEYTNDDSLRPQRSEEEGPTPLIAAMRCFVASRLGDEIEVPDELV